MQTQAQIQQAIDSNNWTLAGLLASQRAYQVADRYNEITQDIEQVRGTGLEAVAFVWSDERNDLEPEAQWLWGVLECAGGAHCKEAQEEIEFLASGPTSEEIDEMSP